MHLVHQARPQIPRDKLLPLPEVEKLSGLKKSTIYLLMKRGDFPRAVSVSPRCVRWPESKVLQWVQDRIASADQLPESAEGGGLPQGAPQ